LAATVISDLAKLHTQIGGKYSVKNAILFSLKRALEQGGIAVSYPILDSLQLTPEGQYVAYDPSLKFSQIELGYYRSIRGCSFHCVANSEVGNEGLIGQSASLEVAFAMAQGKPIFFTNGVRIAPHVSDAIRAIVTRNLSGVHVLENLDSTAVAEGRIEPIAEILVAKHAPVYDLDIDALRTIRRGIFRLFGTIRKSEW
jgi:hypothetical protein